MQTKSHLYRSAGIAAIVAGGIFAGIQPFHPADFLSSVNTTQWSIFMSLKLIMCFLFLWGIAGICLFPNKKTGWTGIAGCVLLCICWALQSGYIFTELFILPKLAVTAPEFVNSFLGMVNDQPGQMDMGVIATVYMAAGICYMAGGVLLGWASYRSGMFPRWAAVLLLTAALVTPAAALLPHSLQRLMAIPVGIAIVRLGYALLQHKRNA